MGKFRADRGLSLSQSFDLRYQPASIASGPLGLTYAISRAGDVAEISDGTTALTFQYDFLDRLVSSPGTFQYEYDATGNRSGETVEGTTASYAYYNSNYSDRLTTRLAAGNVRTHAFGYDFQTNVTAVGRYDANGQNMTRAVCLRHDPLGRLVLVGDANPGYVSPDATTCTSDSPYLTSVSARFKYDFRGRRVARWIAATGVWTYFVHAPDGTLLSELALTSDPSSPWAAVRDYVWLDARPLAHIEYSGSGTGDRYYYHLDHIGLPRMLTSTAGQVVWSATPARPYGDLAETTTPDPISGRTVVTNLRLPGQYDERLLGSIGLQGPYYNWNRWYLPGVGRYLELDPLALRGQANGPFGPDWYNYANGNPLRYTDPWGLYGTNDCSYYEQRCRESGGDYYCNEAPKWCDRFRKYPDPDPNRDDDFEGWARCTRQCLQDCDRDENKNQNACPPTPDDRKGPWDPRSKSFECHKKCYRECKAWDWGLRNTPPYPPRPFSG